MDVSGDKSKMQCCKEQYCIGTWNVRPMNQAKLDTVKQEMARGNINILGISELNGWGWVNLIQITIKYFCEEESFRRQRVALIVNKRSKCSTWVQSHK